MKIKNLEVGIKIGNKEKKLTNLILNSYLDLFAESLLDFQSKTLFYCAVNITKDNIDIDENSTTMEFDTLIDNKVEEILTQNTVLNKYTYTEENTLYGYNKISDFAGQSIKQIGFGNFNGDTNEFVMYAYLDVSKYNITIQSGQPVVISRIDTIKSDMLFWSNNKSIKAPYHLTNDGIHAVSGMDYQRVLPKLYSVGFGVLPYLYLKEYLVEDIDIQKTGTGEITINGIESNFAKDDLFPSPDLYPNPDLYPREATANLLIYKFKMYREVYENPELPPVLQDTGFYYVQYKELTKFGLINNLKIKYERG